MYDIQERSVFTRLDALNYTYSWMQVNEVQASSLLAVYPQLHVQFNASDMLNDVKANNLFTGWLHPNYMQSLVSGK